MHLIVNTPNQPPKGRFTHGRDPVSTLASKEISRLVAKHAPGALISCRSLADGGRCYTSTGMNDAAVVAVARHLTMLGFVVELTETGALWSINAWPVDLDAIAA